MLRADLACHSLDPGVFSELKVLSQLEKLELAVLNTGRVAVAQAAQAAAGVGSMAAPITPAPMAIDVGVNLAEAAAKVAGSISASLLSVAGVAQPIPLAQQVLVSRLVPLMAGLGASASWSPCHPMDRDVSAVGTPSAAEEVSEELLSSAPSMVTSGEPAQQASCFQALDAVQTCQVAQAPQVPPMNAQQSGISTTTATSLHPHLPSEMCSLEPPVSDVAAESSILQCSASVPAAAAPPSVSSSANPLPLPWSPALACGTFQDALVHMALGLPLLAEMYLKCAFTSPEAVAAERQGMEVVRMKLREMMPNLAVL